MSDIAIGSAEPVARILFSPSMIQNGTVSGTAFEMCELPGGPESYVSLFLENIFHPKLENCRLLKVRTEGDVLYGYCTAHARDCDGVSFLDVVAFLKRHEKNTPGHIGLHYTKSGINVKGKCQDENFLLLTEIIAKRFKPISFE